MATRIQNRADHSSFVPAPQKISKAPARAAVIPSRSPPEWAGKSSFERGPIPTPARRSREVLTGNFQAASIEDLKKLEGVTFIDGSLSIDATNLKGADLAALKSLARVSGDLTITNGKALGDLTGLSGLVTVGKNLALTYSEGLTSLDGLQALTEVGRLTVAKTSVTELGPVANLQRAGALWVVGNDRLVDVRALANVKVTATTEAVTILSNPGLPANAVELLAAALRQQGFAGEFLVDSGVQIPPYVPPAVVPPAPPPAAPVAPTPIAVEPLPPIDPKTIRPADWTFFIHLNADNSLEPEAINDLNEAESVGSTPGKVNVIALVEGSGAYVQGRSDWTVPARLMFISKDPDNSDQIVSRQIAIDPASDLGKLIASSAGLPDMADPKLMNAALRYVQEQVPSNHLLVDLWDHGNAWEGVSFSDRSGKFLAPAQGDLATAFEGVKVDVLSSDACMMATVEVAEAAQQLEASFLVGSEEVEPGPGWNYKDVLGRLAVLFDRNAETSAEEVSRAIADSYAAGTPGNATMSVTNLKKLALVRTQLQTFGETLNLAGGLNGNAQLLAAYQASPRYELGQGNQLDLVDFARRVAAAFPAGPLNESATRLIAAVKESSYATSAAMAGSPFRDAGGLSIYAPRGAIDPAYTNPKAPWHDGSWVSFLGSRGLPIDPSFVLPDWAQAAPIAPPPAGIPVGPPPGEVNTPIGPPPAELPPIGPPPGG